MSIQCLTFTIRQKKIGGILWLVTNSLDHSKLFIFPIVIAKYGKKRRSFLKYPSTTSYRPSYGKRRWDYFALLICSAKFGVSTRCSENCVRIISCYSIQYLACRFLFYKNSGKQFCLCHFFSLMFR